MLSTGINKNAFVKPSSKCCSFEKSSQAVHFRKIRSVVYFLFPKAAVSFEKGEDGRERRAGVARALSGPAPRRLSTSLLSFANCRRLVLGCMDSYESEQRRIFLHFSRSTRFAFFCTAPISNFAYFSQFFSDLLGFLQKKS